MLSNVIKCLELISYVESIMLTDVCMYDNPKHPTGGLTAPL